MLPLDQMQEALYSSFDASVLNKDENSFRPEHIKKLFLRATRKSISFYSAKFGEFQNRTAVKPITHDYDIKYFEMKFQQYLNEILKADLSVLHKPTTTRIYRDAYDLRKKCRFPIAEGRILTVDKGIETMLAGIYNNATVFKDLIYSARSNLCSTSHISQRAFMVSKLDRSNLEAGLWHIIKTKEARLYDGKLIWNIEPYILKAGNYSCILGPYRAYLVIPTNGNDFYSRAPFYIQSMTGTPSCAGYIHPHASSGRGGYCLGAALPMFQNLMTRGLVVEAVTVAETLLRTYNKLSPYRQISQWHNMQRENGFFDQKVKSIEKKTGASLPVSDCTGHNDRAEDEYRCTNCGDWIEDDNIYECSTCGEFFCDNCATWCDNCEDTVCVLCTADRHKISYCSICKHDICSKTEKTSEHDYGYYNCTGCGKQVCGDCCDDDCLCKDCQDNKTTTEA